MAHKKYIKRGKKIFGPYIYENYRENGITKTRYLGRFNKDEKKSQINKFGCSKDSGFKLNRNLSSILIAVFGIALLFSLFIFSYSFFERGLTGRVSLELSPSYQRSEEHTSELQS